MTEYHNSTSPTERLEALFNDQKVRNAERRKDTFASRTSADLDLENTGRHSKPAPVVGLDTVQYPTLPENSWANDPVPTEPPLGFVDEAPVCGEAWEVEASLRGLNAQAEALPSPASSAQRGATTEQGFSLFPSQSPAPTGTDPSMKPGLPHARAGDPTATNVSVPNHSPEARHRRDTSRSR